MSAPLLQHVGPGLARLRNVLGLASRDVAAAAGLHVSALSRIEGGRYRFRPGMAVRILVAIETLCAAPPASPRSGP